jgi:hypothetical protein
MSSSKHVFDPCTPEVIKSTRKIQSDSVSTVASSKHSSYVTTSEVQPMHTRTPRVYGSSTRAEEVDFGLLNCYKAADEVLDVSASSITAATTPSAERRNDRLQNVILFMRRNKIQVPKRLLCAQYCFLATL